MKIHMHQLIQVKPKTPFLTSSINCGLFLIPFASPLVSTGVCRTDRACWRATCIVLATVVGVLFSQQLAAYDTAGSMLHVDPVLFNHQHLIQLTWTAEIDEYEYSSNSLRIDFDGVGFIGHDGQHLLYVDTHIQSAGHTFADDAEGIIPSFPALGLHLDSLQSELPDSSHGVRLNADPTVAPRFGRCFENVDNMGFIGKTIYTRENLGDATPTNPVAVKWTVTKGETVTNPPGNFSKNANGDWIPLVGTFVVWNFKIEINGQLFDVANYYLPIEYAEFLIPGDPLVLHQEFFGSASQSLDALKTSVRFTDMKAYDGSNWYGLNDWIITFRIDDGAGNTDNRFGWKSDGISLTSRCGHESDVTQCSRDVGTRFGLLHPAFFSGEIPLGNGVYYLQFPNGTPFGYYAYLTYQHFIYHFDMGYEYWFDANDGHGGIFFYDFASNHFFYTSPSFPFPYLYSFSFNTVLYYYPDPNRPGHYTTNPRYFYNFATGQVITL